MNKEEIIVPGNIRYITEWKDFMSNIKEMPCIIDKQLTGCGFTEWCIRNEYNVVLCSPRRILLENKEEQHTDMVLYAKNENERIMRFDKNLNAQPKDSDSKEEDVEEQNQASIGHFKSQVRSYALGCFVNNCPCKILVTYDSFRFVKEALEEENVFNTFLIVIDEWQSIFVDSKFKSSTELELLDQLKGINPVMYVSATPMIDDYLTQMPEFANMKYYAMDWSKENPYRVIHPELEVKHVPKKESITTIACDIINKYRRGEFDKLVLQDEYGNTGMIYSKEAVFYVNSVKNICDIIKKSEMTEAECNILCANVPDNVKKVKAALNIERGRKDFQVGKVPKRGEVHKMFTFCTRTVYLGADFYSTSAQSYIFSDANIDSLSVDITLDLPQILGRQRLNENPWKNRATLYFKPINLDNKETIDQFKDRIEQKIKRTENLLNSYHDTRDEAKSDVAATYQYVARTGNYKDNYVAVNTHSGTTAQPVFNNLVYLADKRTYEIQQVDFKDRFSVFRQVEKTGSIVSNTISEEAKKFIKEFDEISRFRDKMRFLCTYQFSSENQFNSILEQVPGEYKNYIICLGLDKIRACGYQRADLDKQLNDSLNTTISVEIHASFSVGDKITRKEIKDKLQEIYTRCGLYASPKASDLEQYFELKICQILNKETGKKDHGYEIISKK